MLVPCFNWADRSASFIHGGFSFSQFLPDASVYKKQPKHTFKVGSRIGGGYELAPKGNLSYSLGFAYEKRGGSWRMEDAFGDEMFINLNYLQMPLMLKYSLPIIDKLARVGLAIGPEPALLVAASTSGGSMGGNINGTSSFVLSANIGVMAEINTKTGAVVVQVGYARGIMNAVEDKFSNIYGKNSTIRLSVGWKVWSSLN